MSKLPFPSRNDLSIRIHHHHHRFPEEIQNIHHQNIARLPANHAISSSFHRPLLRYMWRRGETMPITSYGSTRWSYTHYWMALDDWLPRSELHRYGRICGYPKWKKILLMRNHRFVMKWNGMDWNEMEWIICIQYLWWWTRFANFTINTMKSSGSLPMRSLDGSYRGCFFLSCCRLWREPTAKSAVLRWTTGLVGSRWLPL